jgi:hypothetical protein
MTADGDYVPSTAGWVRDQVELYESSGGTSRQIPVFVLEPADGT